jgi:PAS domain S-box-containing protein
VWERGRGIFSEQGQLLYLEGFITDITERKWAEDALRDSEERFRLTMEATSDGLYDANIQTGDRYFSPAYFRMLGYEPGEFPMSAASWQNLMHPEDRSYIDKLNEDYIENRIPSMEGEYRLKAKNGEWRWIFGRGKAVTRDANGRATRIMGTHIDITERKLLSEKMIQSQKLADLGTLAAGVAHEINSPLQIITGSSGNMLAKLENGGANFATFKPRLERINQNAWRIAEIVRSLLDYARSSSGQVTVVNLNDLVRDALLLIEHQIYVLSKIEVITELAENIPKFTCDRGKIIQIVINLLTNARDAMPDGGTVTIRTGFDSQTQRLTMKVIDSGEGIPEAVQAKIFDPFFTTKPLGQGTGLGLSIVMGIVRSHGGEVTVESAPGKGSTFLLTFALTPPVEEQKKLSNGRFSE